MVSGLKLKEAYSKSTRTVSRFDQEIHSEAIQGKKPKSILPLKIPWESGKLYNEPLFQSDRALSALGRIRS